MLHYKVHHVIERPETRVKGHTDIGELIVVVMVVVMLPINNCVLK